MRIEDRAGDRLLVVGGSMAVDCARIEQAADVRVEAEAGGAADRVIAPRALEHTLA